MIPLIPHDRLISIMLRKESEFKQLALLGHGDKVLDELSKIYKQVMLYSDDIYFKKSINMFDNSQQITKFDYEREKPSKESKSK